VIESWLRKFLTLIPSSPIVNKYTATQGGYFSPGMILPSVNNSQQLSSPVSEVRSYYLHNSQLPLEQSPIRNNITYYQAQQSTPQQYSHNPLQQQQYTMKPTFGAQDFRPVMGTVAQPVHHARAHSNFGDIGDNALNNNPHLAQTQMALLEIDRRVNEALKNSSETIKKHANILSTVNPNQTDK
jgi:hypothetical protein